jgi:hypothetical protein
VQNNTKWKLICRGQALLLVCLSLTIASCGKDDESEGSASSQCSGLSGSAWVPKVSGAGSGNHDASVSISQSVINSTGLITGLSQAAPASREVSVTIDMNQDLGETGSLTLMAQVTNFPSGLVGGAFAYLVSLSDGTNEYINLARAGAADDCAGKGYYTCSSTQCSVNSACKINWPSAYQNRDSWELHQGYSSSAIDYPSINIFPTCNWTGGSNQSSTSPGCAFNSTFFPAGTTRLRYGVNYTAKYVLLSDSYASLNGYTADFKVTVVKKTSTASPLRGALDINYILVGNKNIQASRTTKGQRNLNTLTTAFAQYLGQSNPNIKLGNVQAIEWPCDTGGDQYANVDVADLGTMFKASSTLVPAGLDTKAMNIFLVSSITDGSSGSDSNLTILGVDGSIGGPAMNGTAVSGLAVSTFDLLDQYNPNCSESSETCPLTQQEDAFFQLGDTVTHEAGHYLGLQHLSENKGTAHDPVLDTPVCTATQSYSGVSYLTIQSCLLSDTNIFAGTNSTCQANCASYGSYSQFSGQFCPNAVACEFNYVMWWTVKNFHEGTGASDGLLFSSQQSQVMNYHPLVQ